MDLKTFLGRMDVEERDAFASLCSTSRGHLQNVMYGVRPCGHELAVLIEKHSAGVVTRRELCANWLAIWPELERRGASGIQAHGRRSTDQPIAPA